MKNLITAIKASFDASPVPAEVAGLFYAPAPEKTAFPFMTFQLVTDTPTWKSFGDTPESALVQFSIWSTSESPTEACTIAVDVREWLDSITLTITGASLISAEWESDNIIADPDGGFAYHIDYRFNIQKIQGD